MNNMELSLVLFTVLTQAAVGLTVMVAVRRWSVGEGPDVPSIRIEWLVAGLALCAGLIASLFHLGHPGEVPGHCCISALPGFRGKFCPSSSSPHWFCLASSYFGRMLQRDGL